MKVYFLFLFCELVMISSCTNKPEATLQLADQVETSSNTKVQPRKSQLPDWAKKANIYEVNIRQYTKEGTINAFKAHLPRLQKMGVEVLWIMPVHPISKAKRKGTLGSYYAVSDFQAINPDYGTMRDFQELVAEVHNMGMYIIMDWVANHTGWDHAWIKEQPQYYTQDKNGNIVDPLDPATGKSWGWTDVADLNYDNPELRQAMIADMSMWVQYVNVDGFRCDMAHLVPLSFWDEATAHLAGPGKPLFMLAESEQSEIVSSGNFGINYAWEFHHLLNDIANGNKPISKIDDHLAKSARLYQSGYQMYFTSNHDENSWAGTVMERMGDAHQAMAVLTMTLQGIPLIYGGQEEPLTKRLEFFEKDQIDWGEFAYEDFYSTLLKLKKRNHALWNGPDGGRAERINASDAIYAFQREKDGHKIVVILNLTDQPASTKLLVGVDQLRNVFGYGPLNIPQGGELTLQPWEYLVFSSI